MAVETKGVSIKLACKTFMISENCYRYEAKNDNENAQIANRLISVISTYQLKILQPLKLHHLKSY